MQSNSQINPTNLAQVSTITFQPLAQQAKLESIVSTLIFWLPVAIATLAVLYFYLKLALTIWLLCCGAVTVVLLLLLYFAIKDVAMTGFALREQDFVLKRGVIWRKLTVVPFNRIQHIELQRGPIERKLELATLKLYTAGGSGSDLDISGLNAQQAKQLKQHILSFISSEQQNEQ